MKCDSYEITVILLGIGATYQYACNTTRYYNKNSRKLGGWWKSQIICCWFLLSGHWSSMFFSLQVTVSRINHKNRVHKAS